MTVSKLRYIHPGYQIHDELNCNFADIQTTFGETLSRTARDNNQMNAPLDMNGYPILNAVLNPDPLIPETLYEASIDEGVLTVNPKRFMSTITLTEDVTDIAFLDLPCYPGYRKHLIEVTQDGTGGRSFSISNSIYNPSKVAVATASDAITLIEMYTKDEGTTWYVVSSTEL